MNNALSLTNHFHIHFIIGDNTGILAVSRHYIHILWMKSRELKGLTPKPTKKVNGREQRIEPGFSRSKLSILSTNLLFLLIAYICGESYTFQTIYIFIISFDPSEQEHEAGRAHNIVYILQIKSL